MAEERSSPRVRPLDDTWLKAAALGCVWASAEIVLGGFLHNLRIPLAGNLMAGIGIVLMVAIGHLWRVRGLFWRAGLICALMKSLAPSSVILGPMVAITCQACLMELSVRVFRRNAFSYALGAMLAMSWNLVQFLLNNLLAYGNRVIDLYTALVVWSQKSLGLPPGRTWIPIGAILGIQFALGLAAGILGLVIGRRAAGESLEMSSLSAAQVMDIRSGKPARAFPHSPGWLVADLVLLGTVLASTGLAPWTCWLPLGSLALFLWIRRYREAVRPLLRAGFWVSFALLTVLSGALLSSLKSGGPGLLSGVGIGLAMNFRAAVLVVGLAALGTELRSPRVGRILSHGKFRQLPAALEMAVETLPLVIAGLPGPSEVFRRPVPVFHRLVAQTDFWLKRLTLRQVRRADVLLLCGQTGQGKSAALRDLVEGLRADGRRVSGILSPSVQREDRRIGYDLIDVATGQRTELARLAGGGELPGHPRVGRFSFRPEGLLAGQRALSVPVAVGADVVLVDEVGPWELQDQGWAAPLYELTLATDVPMIWVVRADIARQVQAHWALRDPRVADLATLTPETLRLRTKRWLDREGGDEAFPLLGEWTPPGEGQRPECAVSPAWERG